MKILLVKLNHLGDTLLLTPTLRFLRRKFPEVRLDVMVRGGCECVLEGNPDITHLVAIARPEKEHRSPHRSPADFLRACRIVFNRRYDYAFDLSDSDRAKFWIQLSGARVRAINDAYGAVSGWKKKLFNRFSHFAWAREHQVLKDFRTVADIVEPAAQPGPLVFQPVADEGRLRGKLPFLAGLKSFALIHPTSRWAFKQWLPERWAAVADELAQQGSLKVVFSCGPAEREKEYVKSILAQTREQHYATAGQTTLHELGFLLSSARLFLGVDTVAMHLAAAMQVPTVALFGPSSEWSWRPWQCRHELALGDCACKAKREFTCDKSKPYPCMESISVDAVLAAAARLQATS